MRTGQSPTGQPTRHRRLRTFGASALAVTTPVCLASALGVGPAAGAEPEPQAEQQQPNVILIQADDLGYADTTLYGGEVATPNIAALAERGVTFTNGYAAAPVCSPSRHSLLSGRTSARFGADSNFLGRNVIPDQTGDEPPGPNIASVLSGQGYATAAIGKWDISGVRRNATPGDVAGQPNLPDEAGFDSFFGMLNGIAEYCPAGQNELFSYEPADDSYQQRETPQYLTDEFSDRAASYVGEQAGSGNPFFLYLSYNAPHGPLQLPGSCDKATGPDRRPAYEQMIKIMDEGIGRVVESLDAVDGTIGNPDDAQLQNTMIAFVSDNGPQHDWQTGALRGRKASAFEGGLRVPFVLTWPGALEAGTRYDDTVTALDLFPTFAAAAGAAPGTGLDGTDLVPKVTAGEPAHETVSWRYYNDMPRVGGAPAGTVRTATRSGNLKYIREVQPDGAVTEYLFDFARDYDGDGAADGYQEQVNENDNADYAQQRLEVISDQNTWLAGLPVDENFDHAREVSGLPDGWADHGGDWQVTDDGTLTSAGTAASTVTGAGTWFQNVDVAADVTLTRTGVTTLLIRTADGRGSSTQLDGYRVRLAAREGTLTVRRVVDGKAPIVASKDVTVSPGQTYRLHATAEQGELTVQLDGTDQLSWTDADPLPGGAVGIRGHSASVDNLTAVVAS